jgi:hypothetical protein
MALSHAPSQNAAGRSRPSQDTIKDRVSIHERPNNVDARAAGGHWEGDLIVRICLSGRQSIRAATPTKSQERGGLPRRPPHPPKCFVVLEAKFVGGKFDFAGTDRVVPFAQVAFAAL